MKKIEINIQEKSATINGISTSFQELGLSHTENTIEDITEYLEEIHGDDLELSFQWTVNPGIYSVSCKDLTQLGWSLYNDEVANAMEISIEEADEYVEKTYHAEINVNEDGTTLFRLVNTERKLNGIDEGGDNEVTGDDQQTILDLIELTEQEKIWNVIEF